MTELTAVTDSAALADVRRRAAVPDSLRALLVDRIGITADADVATVTAALDRALAERPFAGPPEGSELLESAAVEQLRADAEVGRNVRRDQLLASAIREGRIPPAARPSWTILYDTDPASAEAMLRKLKPNTVPVESIGRSGDADDQAELGRELGFGW